MKIVKKKNQLKIVIFTAVKNHCMLHGRVFVMCHTRDIQVSQHVVSVESSSFVLHGNFSDLIADRKLSKCFEPLQKLRARFGTLQTS